MVATEPETLKLLLNRATLQCMLNTTRHLARSEGTDHKNPKHTSNPKPKTSKFSSCGLVSYCIQFTHNYREECINCRILKPWYTGVENQYPQLTCHATHEWTNTDILLHSGFLFMYSTHTGYKTRSWLS
jgi:hypothetical protein